MTGFSRALPFGATLVDRNRARFRLFAPAQPSVAVDIEDAQSIPMQPQGDGWFEAEVPCDAGDAGPSREVRPAVHHRLASENLHRSGSPDPP